MSTGSTLLVARRDYEQKDKWIYASIDYSLSERIDVSLLFCLIRREAVENAIGNNMSYSTIADMVENSYEMDCPFMDEPIARPGLCQLAAELKIQTIYWITPSGQLWRTRQCINQIFLLRDMKTGRVNVYRVTGMKIIPCEPGMNYDVVMVGNEIGHPELQHKVIATLTPEQEKRLQPELDKCLKSNDKYDIDFAQKEFLIKSKVLKPEDVFDVAPLERVMPDPEYHIDYTETWRRNYLNRKRRKRAVVRRSGAEKTQKDGQQEQESLSMRLTRMMLKAADEMNQKFKDSGQYLESHKTTEELLGGGLTATMIPKKRGDNHEQ